MNEKGFATNKIGNSFIWKLGERFITQFLNLIVQIVLARIIEPAAFGSLAILVIFVNLATIITQKGLSSSLIRKEKATKEDFDCALFVSLCFSLVLYFVLFVLAPFLARFYGDPELSTALRLISLTLVFGSLYCVENAAMTRKMQFKQIFIVGLVSTLFAGAIGIVLAYLGFGLYALVAQTVSHMILISIFSYRYIGFRIAPKFSKRSVKEILSFGGNVLVCELMVYIIESFRSLFIGKRFSTEELSYYNRGQTYPTYLMNAIYSSIGSVMLPAFSQIRDEESRMVNTLISVKSAIMLFTYPAFLTFAVLSREIIELVLTSKWLNAAAFMAVFSISQLFMPTQGLCRQAIYSLGNSKLVLKIEAIGSVFALVLFFITVNYSAFFVAIGALASSIFLALLYSINLSHTLNIPWYKISFSGIKYLLYSAIMLIIPFLICRTGMSIYAKAALSAITGSTCYILLLVVSHDRVFFTMIRGLKKIRGGSTNA